MPLITKEELTRYPNRVVVAGSRSFKDKALFLKVLNDFVLYNKLEPKNTAFISGLAKGPDSMVVDWCKEYNWNYAEYPADWKNLDVPMVKIRRNDHGEQYNALAGHNRNREMAEAGSHLLAIWDGLSPGTKNMLELAKHYSLLIHLVKVHHVQTNPKSTSL